MKRGFTLIELLAVIVVLSIIALISTPIILGIMDDAKAAASLRSAELYLDAIRLSLARQALEGGSRMRNVTCVVGDNRTIICDGVEVEVDMKGEPATGGTITFTNGEISNVENLTIKDSVYSLEDETLIASETSTLVCVRQIGASRVIGSKYTCSLNGTDRAFYVLEDGDNTTLTKGETGSAGTGEIALIMDRNYTDTNVPETVAWCQSGNVNTCTPNITRYVTYMQTAFGSNVIVSIPTYYQVYAVNNSTTLTTTPWLYDNLSIPPEGSMPSYWTSTPHTNSSYAWHVSIMDQLNYNTVNSTGLRGVRPVITLSKSLIN